MEEKKLVPKLRFPGFTEPWEQRKLGDMGKTFNGLAGKTKEDFGHGAAQYVTYLNVFQNTMSDLSMTEKIEIDKSQNEVQYGDILFTTSSETPEEVGMSSVWLGKMLNTYLNSFCFGYRPMVDIDHHFIGNLLRSSYVRNKMKILAQGISRYNISKNKVMDLEIALPSKEEQKLIGSVLNYTDNLITLHQRKLEHLKLKKKSLLQKLFPKEGEVYPELRFPGFTAPWEQRKLGEIVERVTRKNNGQSDRPLTISAQDGLVDQCEYFDRQVASRDMSNYYLIKKGEFAYNKSYSDGYPFGAIKRLDYYDKGALSTLYIIFKIVDDRIGSDFMVAYYMTSLWYKEISKRAAEGARNHGLLNISTEDFFNSELKIPNDIKEQIKVGKFVNQFDQYITLHQRKLEHLQLLKKALLQQLFV